VGSGWRLIPLAERIRRANRVAGHELLIVSDDTMRSRLAGASTYTTILLYRTDLYVRPAADAIVWEHGRRNMALTEAGLLSIVLPVTDETDLAGIGVFAANPVDTQTIMDDDPGVRAGIFRYDLHPAPGLSRRITPLTAKIDNGRVPPGVSRRR